MKNKRKTNRALLKININILILCHSSSRPNPSLELSSLFSQQVSNYSKVVSFKTFATLQIVDEIR